jgi:hypothetical protein
MTKKVTNEYNSIINTDREIIQYPIAYGLFATLDDHYRPLPSTIKVNLFFF